MFLQILRKVIYRKYFLLMFLAMGQPAFSQCPTLIWSDEFDQPSLDTTLWKSMNSLGASQDEYTTYVSSSNKVEDGKLVITARRPYPNTYTSGKVVSKLAFKYGKFEARIKLPAGKGMWPAFWLVSKNDPYGPWPQSGEIDIVENKGSESDMVNGYVNFGSSRQDVHSTGATFTKPYGKFSDDFHTYRLEWAPDLLKWYVDDILYGVKTPSDLTPFSWPFNEEFKVIITSAIGGGYAGLPDETTVFPNTMEIDYVRVYSGSNLSLLTGEKRIPQQASGRTYTITNAPSGSTFNWTVPDGATIVSGENTNAITVDWGLTGGEVTVEVLNPCGQDVYILNVSTYVKDQVFEDYELNRNILFASSTGILEPQGVANPAPNSINNSSTCGLYKRNASLAYDILAFSSDVISNADQYRNGNKRFLMDVYSPASIGSDVYIHLINSQMIDGGYPNGFHSSYKATTKKTMEWETLEFEYVSSPDLRLIPDNSIDRVQVMFANGVAVGGDFYFDNFSNVTSSSASGNQLPEVAFLTPTFTQEYATLNATAAVDITAQASDRDGSVVRVEYYNGTELIGSAITSPYVYTWNVAPGKYTITAKVIDNDGGENVSLPQSVAVNQLYENYIENFEDSRHITFQSANGTFGNGFANPDQNGPVNTSALCGKYTRSYFDFDVMKYAVEGTFDGSEFSLKRKEFHMDVYTTAPVGSKINIQLQNATKAATGYPNGVHSFYTVVTTTQNQWETLEFELAEMPDQTLSYTEIDQLLILFDAGHTASNVFYFDNLTSIVYPNKLPKAEIVHPYNYSSYRSGSNMLIEVEASDTDGRITQVDFYISNNLIGSDNTAPFSYVYRNLPVGEGSIAAIAKDNGGGSVKTDQLEFVVNKSDFILDDFETNRNMGYYGSNGIPNHSRFTQVFANPDRTAVNTSATCGKYVRSNLGSDYLEYTLHSPLTVSDFTTSKKLFTMDVYTTKEDLTPVYICLGNINGIKDYFYGVISKSNTWFSVTFNYIGSNTTITGDITDLYILLDPNSTVDNTFYLDNIVTVDSKDLSPLASIITPEKDKSYDLGASVVLEAMAFDPDGTIAQVEFYQGSTLIGTATKEPYSITWLNPPTGIYLVTARASDKAGNVTVSNAVTITVGSVVLSNEPMTASANLKVYPNPSSGLVNVEFKGLKGESVHLVLADQLGMICYDDIIELNEEGAIQLDLSSFPKGVYHLISKMANRSDDTRIIKQ